MAQGQAASGHAVLVLIKQKEEMGLSSHTSRPAPLYHFLQRGSTSSVPQNSPCQFGCRNAETLLRHLSFIKEKWIKALLLVVCLPRASVDLNFFLLSPWVTPLLLSVCESLNISLPKCYLFVPNKGFCFVYIEQRLKHSMWIRNT